MVTGSREDYLICIHKLTQGGGVAKTNDIAQFMKVSPASVTEMMRRLAEENLVDYEKYRGVRLTRAGQRHAKQIRRKHRLMERFLVNILDTDAETAHEEACKLEHVLSDSAAQKLCRIIGEPEECTGCDDTCDGICVNHSLTQDTVASMNEGDAAVISHLRCENAEKIRKLISMGFVPGRRIVLENDLPFKGPLVLRIGDSRVALDRDYADLIFVDRD
ncbi:MAG: metal-dependent transcriptional regulator [Candidatus Methanomethylophilaceae archaeon]|nr:metal-dependent transcriptional regulator [Candidatus Methanomethylophilaceae archaeon]